MKKIEAITLVESKRKNKYFYDQQGKGFQWCHPLLYHIMKLHEQGINPAQWFGELPGGPVHVEGYGDTTKEEIAYYYRKYELLRENGFLSTMDLEHYLSGRLSADIIKSSLANIRQATFEVVDYCNLDCDYCAYGKFYDNYDRRMQQKCDTGTAKTFLNYLLELLNSPLNHSHGRTLYIGFYGGEPLLNFPFIREIVAYVQRLQPLHNHFAFSMTTNGLLLEKYMDFLVEHDFFLLISLDGNEQNNSYRVFRDGSPAFRRIVKNVTALKTKYPEYFKKNVNFNAVLHNRNSVSDIYNYFKTHFDVVPNISELNPSGIKHSMREEFWKTYANFGASLSRVEDYSVLEKDMFIRLPNIHSVSRFIDQCSGFVFKDYHDLLASERSYREEARIPTATCLPFSRKAFLTVNGKILPCERIGQQYALGYAGKTKVEMDFKKVADMYNNYYEKLKSRCCDCANAEACLQCMFFLEIEKADPKCKGLFNKEEFSRFLSTQVSHMEENPHVYKRIMEEVSFE